jgi:hypothetical protein
VYLEHKKTSKRELDELNVAEMSFSVSSSSWNTFYSAQQTSFCSVPKYQAAKGVQPDSHYF